MESKRGTKGGSVIDDSSASAGGKGGGVRDIVATGTDAIVGGFRANSSGS